MAHIDSADITIDHSRMTVRFAEGEILAAPLTARVDTDTGDVTFRTDPAGLLPVTRSQQTGARPPSPADPPSDLLRGAVVAFLVAPEGAEESELAEPWAAVRDAGGTPVLVSTVSGAVHTFSHLDRATTHPVDNLVAEVSADEFDALVLPGGVASPDYLRTRPDVLDLVGAFFTAGTPVAAICHAPWTLIDAGVVRGRRLTSWPSLRTDLANAGADWVDSPVVTCDQGPNTLVTSRGPDDLDEFCTTIVSTIAQSVDARRQRKE